ncbi:hypothetical protein [Rhizobium sp. SG741]|uniref:hypothetical protein n=1 Tax=Rhizobium sp. SG741 TaxID=2587114 RepID=UPI0014450888|nr:hypothetical protein [Rhizobium sp. SG741]NKJ03149.1 hypothetical protein [Rhizobium sp. SG741]
MFGFSLKKDRGVSAQIGAWEKTSKFFPVWLVEGEWSWEDGQLWRRRSPDGWQYTQDEPTWEEREAAAW